MNNFVSENIEKELGRQFFELSKTRKVFGVFLYGSQNYGCDTENSDIDTKAIIIPSLDDLLFRAPVSMQVRTECGECDVKDIREMFRMFKKQNVNFLEILFTEYYFVPEEFRAAHERLRSLAGSIARYDERHAASCILGMYNRELSRLYKEDEDVEKYGYRRKSYCNILRLQDTMKKYVSGEPDYRKVITCPQCRQYKTRVLPANLVEENVRAATRNIEKMFDAFEPAAVRDKVGEKMDEFVRDIVSEHIGVRECC